MPMDCYYYYNFAVGPGNGGSFGLLYDLENIDFTQTVRKYEYFFVFSKFRTLQITLSEQRVRSL